MGDYGTYRVVGAGQVSSVNLIVQNNVIGLNIHSRPRRFLVGR
jgi:hypothetical protein